MADYKASNVEDAIVKAQEFQKEGRYNWFRGQVNAEWQPWTSAFRAGLTTTGAEAAALRQQEFLAWTKTTIGCESISAEEHAPYAIMQHYGIRTRYLDFTTDPAIAGFFAADTTKPEPGVNSCIVCLNTDDLLHYWEANRQPNLILELVRPKLPNLWRLHAQEGVFLFTDFNWDLDYPPDRIVFPYTGYPTAPLREFVYPTNKSPLEILLDQYFDRESSVLGVKVIRGLEAKGLKATWIVQQERPPPKGLETHPSWDRDGLKPWLMLPDEEYSKTAGSTLNISLRADMSPEEIGDKVRSEVVRRLQTEVNCRRTSVSFHLTGLLPKCLRESEKNIELKLGGIWDGMRRLPFAEAHLVEAMGNGAALFALGFHLMLPCQRQTLASEYFGNSLAVAFSADDQSESRGYASEDALKKCVRTDAQKILPTESERGLTHMETLLFQISSPQLLFEFGTFAELFARQIIPTQVLARTRILYSPARLSTFGLS